MNTYIALLKGINVGGHKKVPMAKLRELLTDSGFQNVQTYIQSGNVIFKSSETNIHNIENRFKKIILDAFEFEVSILVLTRLQLQYVFDSCPFSDEKKKASYFMLLHDIPNHELVKVASEKVYEGESYKIIKNCIYYFNPKGFGQAKFNVNFFERQLNTFATARNYNTMQKLIVMSSENEKDQ